MMALRWHHVDLVMADEVDVVKVFRLVAAAGDARGDGEHMLLMRPGLAGSPQGPRLEGERSAL